MMSLWWRSSGSFLIEWDSECPPVKGEVSATPAGLAAALALEAHAVPHQRKRAAGFAGVALVALEARLADTLRREC